MIDSSDIVPKMKNTFEKLAADRKISFTITNEESM